MESDAPDDEFLMRVATYIDAPDIGKLRDQWGRTEFEEVTIYVWSRIPCVTRRLMKLVEWQRGIRV
jgi:hypothetical protein